MHDTANDGTANTGTNYLLNFESALPEGVFTIGANVRLGCLDQVLQPAFWCLR
jgi:hypothetical protein